MTKPLTHTNKTEPPVAPETETPTSPEALEAAVDDTGSALTAAEQEQLLYSTKFLLNVMSPRFDRARVLAGYTGRDHAEGWSLFRRASGEDLALAALAAVNASGNSPEPALPLDALRNLDSFENKWFPRTRRIIERFAAADEKEAMVDAFFLNLTQQPLGPGLMQSVPTFILRVRDLGAGKFKSAGKVRAELARRGLTDGVLDTMQRAVDGLRGSEVVPADGEDAVDAEAEARVAAEAQQAQREGFEAFRVYWLDWSETFREELSRREAIILGVSSPRAKKPTK